VGGSFLSLMLIGALVHTVFPQDEPWLLMSAFGSSAVLIFTMPELLTAQPWPAVFGHVLAALTGVFIRENLGLPYFAAVALAVALSLLLMFLTSSLHPPAGGTAIAAVGGSGPLGELGYGLAFFPMAAGMILLVVLAALWLPLAAGRTYPLRRSYRVVEAEKEKSRPRHGLTGNFPPRF
jgi:CBS-domain-containing membrane protein